jgi:transcriptional regulator with XRE-family HTH domain
MVAEILRSYRRRLNASQEELAHSAGVDRTYVGKVERATLNPTIFRINRLLHAMGKTWQEFGQVLDRELDSASRSRAAGRQRTTP